jgi:hypothetical protein
MKFRREMPGLITPIRGSQAIVVGIFFSYWMLGICFDAFNTSLEITLDPLL